MFTHYCIPRPENVSEDGIYPDYYPLTKEEITQLCHSAQNARNSKDYRTLACIQIRLVQGIVGKTSPVPSEGPVAVAEARLDEYFTRNVEWYGSDPTFTDELYEIMHFPEKEEN